MTATTLSQYTKIQAKLQLEIMDVKAEVQRLKGELKKDQDPAKMGRIQKQIGVCSSPHVDMSTFRQSRLLSTHVGRIADS